MVDRGAVALPVDAGEPVVPASVDELIAALPKVEFHVHLEGSMQPTLLLELARKHGVVGLSASLEAVRQWYGFRDFPHFIDVYQAAVQTLRDQEDFALLVEQTAAALAAQNVRYAEVIVTPWLHLDRGIPAEHVFGGLERGREAAERELGIQLRWLADFPGHHGVDCGHKTLDAVLEAGLDSVIGFNVGCRWTCARHRTGASAPSPRVGRTRCRHCSTPG